MLGALKPWWQPWRRTDAALARWLVLDCETSGLDARRDRLLSIGGAVIEQEVLRIGHGFECLIRHDVTSERGNILVHGIGGEAQRAGEPAAEALARFLAWAGDSPCVAWHAPFDRAVLERACRSASGRRWSAPWIDLAELMPVLFPDAPRGSSLDQWLERCGIAHDARHNAAADAHATAQLFLVALAHARREGFRTVGDMHEAARAGGFAGRHRL